MAHDALFNLIENLRNLFCLLRIFNDKVFHRFGLNRRDIGISSEFILVAGGGVKTLLRINADLFLKFFGDGKDRRNLFFLSADALYIFLKFNQTADLGMSEQDSV